MITITDPQIKRLIALEQALGERLTRSVAQAIIDAFVKNRLALHRDLSAILEWKVREAP